MGIGIKSVIHAQIMQVCGNDEIAELTAQFILNRIADIDYFIKADLSEQERLDAISYILMVTVDTIEKTGLLPSLPNTGELKAELIHLLATQLIKVGEKVSK